MARVGGQQIEVIRKQLAMVGASQKMLNKPEVRSLPNILAHDENINGFVFGFYSGGMGMLVATDNRLIFVDKMFIGLKIDDVRYDMVTAVEYDVGMFYGKLTVYTRAKNFDFRYVSKQAILPFAREVERRMHLAEKSLTNKT